jgi:ribonuclease HII
LSGNSPIIIAGVDEAGRGALAGPVIACCAVLKESFKLHNDVNDSKKLTEKKRYELFDTLKNDIYLGIGLNSHRYINQHNVLNATMAAMATAVRKNRSRYNHIIIDGNKAPKLDQSHETMVKADAKVTEVMVASICAKVIRDKLMLKYNRLYGGYGFDRHKGYGTKKHYDALFNKGPCPVHRTSFNLNKQLTLF